MPSAPSDNTLTPLGDKVQYRYAGGAFLGLLDGLEALVQEKLWGIKLVVQNNLV